MIETCKQEQAETATECQGCIYLGQLWGLIYCCQGHWAGVINAKNCAEYRRAE